MIASRGKYRRNVLVCAQIQSLEDRCLLSAKPPAQITIQEVPSSVNPGMSELLITGTKNNDGISINDNGTGTAGNIFVSLDDGRDYESVGAIDEIAVATGKGKDHVTYELDGNLQPGVNELVFLGSGLKKGGGTVQLTVNVVGKILDTSMLEIIGAPDPKKKTTMIVNDSGDIDGELIAGIAPLTGSVARPGAPELFTLNSTANIGSNGILDTGLRGASRNDVAAISYAGTNNGEIAITAVGDGGNDQLDADVYMAPGSTGTVGQSGGPSVMEASGKSRLRFTVALGTDSTTATNVFAKVVALSRKVMTVRTANVTAPAKGSDSIVS